MQADSLLEMLRDGVVVADGAMGTMLNARGVPWNACFEALNLDRTDLVKAVHLEYVVAGSQLIETNTFAANRNRLASAGIGDSVKEVNAAAVRLARSVIPNNVFLAGAVGPYGRAAQGEQEVTDEERSDAFTEQIEILASEGVDLIVLETFAHATEAKLALQAARRMAPDLPVVCQMAFAEALRTTGGADAVDSLLDLKAAGASVVGGNCGAGPLGLIHVIQETARRTEGLLSAQPNASFPQYVNGRYIYVSDPEYFAESAVQIAELGANLIGGCCGTTPEHIRLVAERVKGRRPAVRRLLPSPPTRPRGKKRGKGSPPDRIYSPIDRIGETKVALVEVKPPRGVALGAVRRAARMLVQAGVDAFSLVENSLAQVRMSPFALAHVLQEEFGVAAVVHCTCRDRNLMGQQSALTGAAALGVRTVLALTGDPASMGDSSESTSVYDSNSLGLIELIAGLNTGINVAGNPISGSPEFVIGAAFNPNVRRLAPEVRRLEKKVAKGARFAMTQPVFDPDLIPELYEATAHLDIPILLGVMPLTTYRNAAFLHHEVPGIRIPEPILDRMRQADEKGEEGAGLAVARELVDVGLVHAPGFYFMPQMEKYRPAADLVRYVKQAVGRKKLG